MSSSTSLWASLSSSHPILSQGSEVPGTLPSQATPLLFQARRGLPLGAFAQSFRTYIDSSSKVSTFFCSATRTKHRSQAGGHPRWRLLSVSSHGQPLCVCVLIISSYKDTVRFGKRGIRHQYLNSAHKSFTMRATMASFLKNGNLPHLDTPASLPCLVFFLHGLCHLFTGTSLPTELSSNR
jgi:hypothetical protein